MVKRKRKLKEDEELIKVVECEEIAEALDDIREALTNADKLTVAEDEELDFYGAVEKIKEAIEDLDIEDKEKVVEELEHMSEEGYEMKEDEVKDFVEDVKELTEEIESLDEEDEKDEVNEEDESLDEEEDEKESLKESEDEVNEEDEEDEVNEEDEKESLEESVNRIFGKLSLNEETKVAVRTLIEAKIKEEEEELTKDLESKCEEYAEELKKEAEEELQEAIDDLNKKADSYLNHVAEEWAEENKLAIKEGLRVQIAENFMNGLKKLLKENDIEFDEEKEDVVKETIEKCEELQDKLDEVLADKAELQEQVKALTKFKIISENTRDLTQVQRDRLSKILEGVSYKNESELLGKIKVLKENYINTPKQETLNEEVAKKNISEKSNEIDAYASFITRTNR